MDENLLLEGPPPTPRWCPEPMEEGETQRDSDEEPDVIDLSDFISEAPPPTPRWHPEPMDESRQDHESDREEARGRGEEEEDDPDVILISDEEFEEEAEFWEHKHPRIARGVRHGQAYEELHCRRVVIEGNQEWREWTSVFITHVEKPDTRTVARAEVPRCPTPEPVVKFPDEPTPTATSGQVKKPQGSPVRPNPRAYHIVPRDRWPSNIRREVEAVLAQGRTGRVRFCRFEGRHQYLVRVWKGRTVVECRPRK